MNTTDRTPYCFHCELKHILEHHMKAGAVDLDEALQCFSRCLGEIIAECPNWAEAIEEARRTVVYHSRLNIETTTKTRH
jgi:hypothetical protein